jgi:arginase
VRLIAVPYDIGIYNNGHGRGPKALLDAGLERILSDAGHNVETTAVVLDNSGQMTDIQATFVSISLVAREVAAARALRELPIVLAGNCITSAGIITGLQNKKIKVLWLDAHADYNTPETTESGYLDGMALSVVCGRCWKHLSEMNNLLQIGDDQVVLIGTRDVDSEEESALSHSKIKRSSVNQLRSSGYEIPKGFITTSDELHIHIDADVIDRSVGHANRFASDGGLMEEEIVALLSKACINRVGSVAVTAYGPDYDKEKKVVESLKMIIVETANAIDANDHPTSR